MRQSKKIGEGISLIYGSAPVVAVRASSGLSVEREKERDCETPSPPRVTRVKTSLPTLENGKSVTYLVNPIRDLSKTKRKRLGGGMTRRNPRVAQLDVPVRVHTYRCILGSTGGATYEPRS